MTFIEGHTSTKSIEEWLYSRIDQLTDWPDLRQHLIDSSSESEGIHHWKISPSSIPNGERIFTQKQLDCPQNIILFSSYIGGGPNVFNQMQELISHSSRDPNILGYMSLTELDHVKSFATLGDFRKTIQMIPEGSSYSVATYLHRSTPMVGDFMAKVTEMNIALMATAFGRTKEVSLKVVASFSRALDLVESPSNWIIQEQDLES